MFDSKALVSISFVTLLLALLFLGLLAKNTINQQKDNIKNSYIFWNISVICALISAFTGFLTYQSSFVKTTIVPKARSAEKQLQANNPDGLQTEVLKRT